MIERPSDIQTITSRWIFKQNLHGDNKIYKACLEARGFQQDQNFDFKELYSPVTNLNTVCTVLCLSVLQGHDIHQIDIGNAFLNGHLK